jgi:hypothetical protein
MVWVETFRNLDFLIVNVREHSTKIPRRRKCPSHISFQLSASLAAHASSTAPADWLYHLVDLRFFTVDSGIGAKQRPFHGAMADAEDARRPTE